MLLLLQPLHSVESQSVFVPGRPTSSSSCASAVCDARVHLLLVRSTVCRHPKNSGAATTRKCMQHVDLLSNRSRRDCRRRKR